MRHRVGITLNECRAFEALAEEILPACFYSSTLIRCKFGRTMGISMGSSKHILTEFLHPVPVRATRMPFVSMLAEVILTEGSSVMAAFVEIGI